LLIPKISAKINTREAKKEEVTFAGDLFREG
jgi:hypothetical protein